MDAHLSIHTAPGSVKQRGSRKQALKGTVCLNAIYLVEIASFRSVNPCSLLPLLDLPEEVTTFVNSKFI